jgi:hypothetical protein
MKHEYDSYPYYEFVRKQMGQEAFDELHVRWNRAVKFKDWDLEEIIDKYTVKLKEVEGGQ